MPCSVMRESRACFARPSSAWVNGRSSHWQRSWLFRVPSFVDANSYCRANCDELTNCQLFHVLTLAARVGNLDRTGIPVGAVSVSVSKTRRVDSIRPHCRAVPVQVFAPYCRGILSALLSTLQSACKVDHSPSSLRLAVS